MLHVATYPFGLIPAGCSRPNALSGSIHPVKLIGGQGLANAPDARVI